MHFLPKSVKLACLNRLAEFFSGWLMHAPAFLLVGVCMVSVANAQTGTAWVRHAPSINGTVEGSVQVMMLESVALNGGSRITGDLLVAGTPTIRLNGKPDYAGTLDGAGSAQPATHQVTLNGGTSLRNVIRRTDSVMLPSVSAPPQPTGSRTVIVNTSGADLGDFATLRNLTLNGNAGQFAIPAGTYGDFTASAGSGFILGVAGATEPSVYHFQRLTLNGQTRLDVVGPVVITVANGFTGNGGMGSSAHPTWLTLNIHSGGFTLNGGCIFNGYVSAPTGTVVINGKSELIGGVSCDRLTINGNGLLRLGERNRAPVAASQSVTLDEDAVSALMLSATDIDSDSLTYFIVTLPAHGTLTFADGSALPALDAPIPVSSAALRYTPALNYHDSDSFTFRARDAVLDSNIATVSLTLLPVNDVPVATPLTFRTDEDTPVALTLSGVDADGDTLGFTIVDAPSRGTLSGTPPALIYTPAPDAHGSDSFSYTVNDSVATSAPAVVTIEITPINDRPIALSQNLTVSEGDTLLIQLAGTDADGDPLTYSITTPPAAGSLLPEPDSPSTAPVYRYTPPANTNTTVTFEFVAADAELTSSPATVSIVVVNRNDPPVALPAAIETDEDVAVVIPLAATDPDGDELVYTLVAPPTHGVVTLAGNLATYTPTTDFHGADSFTFIGSDGGSPALVSAPATISITVRPGNDAPVVDAGADASVTLPAFGALSGMATDIDGDVLTYAWSLVSGPAAPVFEHPTSLATRVELPAAGTYVLRLTASDGELSGTDDVTVTVNASDLVFRTYTTSDDFAEGVNSNVHTEVPDQLQLNAESSASHFLWVAVSSKGTVVKINTRTGRIEGEYWTAPAGQPRNPSRTTVDLHGSVWTGNRDGNSVVHIGSVESGLWVDKNGNGQPDTSLGYGDIRAWTNAGGADTAGGVDTAADECIIHYVRTSSTGTRHLSVNRDNNIWVSGTGTRKFDLIDGRSGALLRTEGPVGYGGYGGVMDRQGVIWSTSWSSLLRWDSSKPLAGAAGDAWSTVSGSGQYGLALAPDGYVWASTYGPGIVYKIAPDGTVVGQYPQGNGSAQGIAVDRRGHVWVAHSTTSNTVGHLRPDGVLVGKVTVGSGPTGIAVDGDGKIWVTNHNSGTVSRINPLVGPLGADGETPVGAVEYTSPYLGGQVYNYSDMTGSTLVAPPLTGVWTTIFDSGKTGAAWGSINWHARIYDDSKITITVASSTDNLTFSPWRVGVRGQDLDVPDGRYLKINVLFQRSTSGHSPELYDLTVGEEGYLPDYPFNTAAVIEAPARQAANYGVEASLQAKVGDDGLPHPSNLSYEWSVVSGPGSVSFDDTLRTDATATFSTTGSYVLRLTATDGQFITSEDISVIANFPPTVNAGPDRPVREAGGTATFAGSVYDDGASLDGLHTEWTQVFGPAIAAMDDASSLTPVVTLPSVGRYYFELTASDGWAEASDRMEVRVGPAVSTAVPRDPVAWWPFDANYVDVVGGRIASPRAAPLVSTVLGRGLGLSGVESSQAVFAADGSLNVGVSPAGFTMELWVNPTSYRDVMLLEWGTATTAQTSLRQWSSGRGLYAYLLGTDGQYRSINATNVLVANTWQHVAVTYDRVTGWARLYRNGVLLAEQHLGLFDVQTTQDLHVGGCPRENRWFHGVLDEVAIYDRPLTATEIRALHLASDTGRAPYSDNQPPVVSAGQHQVLRVPGLVSLHGVVTDDGPVDALNYAWRFVSGPALAELAEPNSLTPTANLTTAGTYVFELRADDGLLAASDQVEVRVGVTAAPPPTQLAAWWPLNAHPREVINGNHDLELMNGLFYAPGRVSDGLTYDGVNDFARTPGHADLDVGSSPDGFTVELWINPASFRDVPLVEWGTPTGSQTTLAQWWSGRGLYAFLMGEDGAVRTVGIQNVLAINTWQHIALSYDRPSGWVRLFRDGVLLHEQNVGSFAVRTTQDFYVGSRPRETRWFHGSMDEPTLYARALTAAEITAIHAAGAAGKAPFDGNLAPQVNAGPDQAIGGIAGVAALSGTVSDDDLPAGGGLAALWTQLSGPGTANFADAESAQTTVSFDQPGTYVLRLQVDDGLLITSDDVEVRVGVTAVPPPSQVAAWWPLNAHPREVINGGHDLELMNGLTYAPGRVAQGLVYDGVNDFARTAGHADLNVGASADGFTLEMWVNPASFRDVILAEWGTQTTSQTTIAQWWSGRGLYAFLVGEDGVTRTVAVQNIFTTGAWQHIAVSYDRPTGWARLYHNGVMLIEQNIGSFAVRTTQDFYVGSRPRENRWFHGGLDEPTLYTRALSATEIAAIHATGAAGKAPFDGNTAPQVVAGPNQILASVEETASLVGEASDDGLPAGGVLVTQWSQLSGPGIATFADPADPLTTVTFDQAGTYVLELRADDGLLVSAAQMEVRVEVTPAVTPSQVAAWWPLNAHPREVINGGHDLELMNGLTYAPGRVAQGLVYDGVNDFARTAGHADLNVGASADGFTLEMWVNPTSFRDAILAEWGTPTSSQTTIAQWWSGRGLYAFLVGEDGVTRTVAVQNIFTTGAWQHIAVSYDRPTGLARLYRNGVMLIEQNIGSFAVRTTQDFYVGSRPRENRWFHGGLDEPTLYTRALTTSEIVAIHAAGIVGKAPPLENRAPVVSVGGPRTTTLGVPLDLSANVSDDDLPFGAGLSLLWSQVSGPGNAGFSAATSSATQVTFDAAGGYILRLTASDTRLTTSADLQVTVLAPLPVVSLTAPTDGAQLVSGSPVVLVAEASISAGSIERVEFYDGASLLGAATTPAPSSTSAFAFTIGTGFSTGSHVLTARAVAASSGAATTSSPVTITAAPYTGPEIVQIVSPIDGIRITAPTEINGLVARPALASWKLEYRLVPPEGTPVAVAPWTTLAGGTGYVGTPANGSTPAVPGSLGTLDPTLLLNGLYELRLAASTSAGSTLIAPGPTVLVEGNMKVGAFTVAFNDLVESAGGIPITFTRSYDSRDRRAGDFGPGWHLTLGNVRVQKNTSIADGWEQMEDGFGLSQVYFIEPTKKHLVTVTFPDGETHRFEAGIYVPRSSGPVLPDNYQWLVPIQQGQLVFKPIGDTTSLLAVDGDNTSYFSGMLGEEILTQGVPFIDPPFEPTRFRLTTADGTIMILDEKLGLLELRDPTGNRLVIHRRASDNRIESVDSIQAHADGPITRTVEINRHADGCIDTITDLAGRTLDYLYDPQGRLKSFTDRELNSTQFLYEKSDNPAHPQFAYLTKILDPRSLPALRCEYDDEGRLAKQIDSDGNETVFDRGIGAFGRFEKITDRLGHATSYFYDDRGNVTAKVDPLGATTTYDYYPDSDRVKFEEDHYGNVKGFAYDARGNVTVEILGASRDQEPATATTGHITRTAYTSFSAPLSITDPDGRVQSFTYDPTTQQLLTHTVGQLAPDASSEIVAASPATTTYTYHPDGDLWTVTDALGNLTTTTYTYGYTDPAYPGAVKRVTTTVVDPAGASGSDTINATATTLRTTYSYHDAQDNLLATVTPRTLADGTTESVPTRYAYDAENRLRFTVLPDGRIQETRYTSFGQTEKTLEWPVGTDLAALIAAGPTGPTTGARVTSMEYDARGNVTNTTLPDGTSTSIGYDLENRPVWRQDARGYRMFTVYDQVGRSRFTIQPDEDDGTFEDAPVSADDPRLLNNPRSETRYDLVGRVTLQIDERGATTETRYFTDGAPNGGRREKLVQHLDDEELVTTYDYYPSGQVRSVVDPRGYTTSTRYDSHGRLVRTLLPATDEHPATETGSAYNVLGQRVAMTDQEGKIIRHRHDALGRLVEVRQYLDQAVALTDANFTLAPASSNVVSTTYAYDEAGNQITQTDARGNVTRYEHDVLGRRLKRILPATVGASKFEALRYDAWGDLWQRDDFAGHTTTFGYDAFHRLKSKQAGSTHPSLLHAHATARVEYDYDDSGAREAARSYNASGSLLYTETTPRDERGRIEYKDTGASRLDYDYYANGLLKDVVSSNTSGVNVGYRYDTLNRLAYVDDATNGLPVRTTDYSYTANGSLETVTYANGLSHTYGYDSLNRLRSLVIGRSSSSVPLQGYDYRLRASGHRREVVETGTTAAVRTATYAYDDLYRLKGETITGDPQHSGAVDYTLDKVGNRESRISSILDLTSRTGLTYNGRDQVSSDTYDANGNTLTGVLSGTGILPVGSSVTVPDVYDFEDRLIIRTRADGSTVNLSYDADGVRIGKTIHNAVAQLVSSTSYLVCTNNLTGYAQVLEERKTDESGTTLKTYTYGSDLISVTTSGTSLPVSTSYFLYDGGGSVRTLADETGALTDRYTYDAFGVILSHTGISDNAYLYRGEQWDTDLGLYYLRARFLNPDSGRFWNQDTYEGSNTDPASLHKYLYAHANPVMFSDPSGNVSLVETQMAQGVGSNLNRIAIPRVARIVGRIYDVYYGFSYSFPFGHSGIFVNTKVINQGWLFHVIPLKSNGAIQRRTASLRAFTSTYKPSQKFTEFNQIEFLVWVASLRLIDAEDDSLTPVNYQIFGLASVFGNATNCHQWALKAAVSAVVISRRIILK